MQIDTTMNIDRDILIRLDNAAARLGISRRHMISSLLGCAPRKAQPAGDSADRVRYQERQDKHRWRTVHVTLRKDEYEFFMDLRKVFKHSVSFLVAWAIDQYLDELIIKMRK